MKLFQDLNKELIKNLKDQNKVLKTQVTALTEQRTMLLDLLERSYKYLRHPDIQRMPFAVPISVLTDALKEVLKIFKKEIS